MSTIFRATSLSNIWDGDTLVEVFASGARGFTKRCGTRDEALEFLRHEGDQVAIGDVAAKDSFDEFDIDGRLVEVPPGVEATMFELDLPTNESEKYYCLFGEDGALVAEGEREVLVLSALIPPGDRQTLGI